MSNSDRNLNLGQRDGAGGSTGECAAESLKSLIAHVANQITDADQRHTEMLRQMQARLQSLGIETRSIRDRVPGAYVPAFDRIEEGMQLLADRIAHTHDARSEFSATTPSQSVGADLAPHFAHMTAVKVPVTPAAAAPAPAARNAEPWDRDQADALANLYHSGAAGMPAGLADPEAYSFAAVDDLAVPGASHASDIEREWLEDRFADIARRVEQSLSEMRPDSSFVALGRRFDQFEERIGSVLEDVATRSDVEGLRIIEAHISELAQHLEQTQLQLERLDGIESQLNAVVSRLSDDRFDEPGEDRHFAAAQVDDIVNRTADRLATQLSGTAGRGDYEQLASRVAEQAITRFASDFRQPREEADLDTGDLRSIVEDFIRERRQGEEQTAAVLDTVQQAMIRVMDRIDAIELNSHKGPVPAAPHEYVREQVRFAVDTRDQTDLGAMRAAADHGKNAAELAAQTTSFSSGQGGMFAHSPGADRRQPSVPQSGSALPIEAIAAAHAAQVQSAAHQGASSPQPQPDVAPAASRSTRASIEKLRHDFIADAQRAKLRAQTEDTAVSEAVATGAAIKLSKPSKATAPTAGKATAAATPGAIKSGAGGMPIKKILVGALGLVIVLQGANLLMARRGADGAKPVATPAKAVAPSGSETSGSAKPANKPRTETKPSAAASPSIVNPNAAIAPDLDLEAVESPVESDRSEAPSSAQQPKSSTAKSTAPPATSKFVVPTVPHKPNTVPETMLDELDFKGKATPGDGERRASQPEQSSSQAMQTTGSVPVGISLQTSDRRLTPYDLARLQQQQQMANLSSKLGVAAAKATPASLLPDLPPAPTGNVAAALAEKSAQQKSALELPPVTVGPLSLRLAAAKGDPSAEFEVGARLAEGKGTDQSFKEAVKWYTRSANQGFAQAQYRLGTLYERGLGVKSDPGRARVWYSRAAEQGNVKAMHNLAVLSAGSKSGSPDYSAAAHWFGEAAVRGLADSQFNLAVLYESGLGVSKDQSLAYQWFSLAARSGDQEAVRRRDLAKGSLPASEATAIEARVVSWLPQSPDQMANDARAAGEAWKRRENADEGNG